MTKVVKKPAAKKAPSKKVVKTVEQVLESQSKHVEEMIKVAHETAQDAAIKFADLSLQEQMPNIQTDTIVPYGGKVGTDPASMPDEYFLKSIQQQDAPAFRSDEALFFGGEVVGEMTNPTVIEVFENVGNEVHSTSVTVEEAPEEEVHHTKGMTLCFTLKNGTILWTKICPTYEAALKEVEKLKIKFKDSL